MYISRTLKTDDGQIKSGELVKHRSQIYVFICIFKLQDMRKGLIVCFDQRTRQIISFDNNKNSYQTLHPVKEQFVFEGQEQLCL